MEVNYLSQSMFVWCGYISTNDDSPWQHKSASNKHAIAQSLNQYCIIILVIFCPGICTVLNQPLLWRRSYTRIPCIESVTLYPLLRYVYMFEFHQAVSKWVQLLLSYSVFNPSKLQQCLSTHQAHVNFISGRANQAEERNLGFVYFFLW